MKAVQVDGETIGNVAKAIGNKPAERWVAFTVHNTREEGEPIERDVPGFPTQREAIEYLEEFHKKSIAK